MAKSKYRYNPDTLSYERIKRSLLHQSLYISTYILFVGILLFIGYFVLTSIFVSPREREQQQYIEDLTYQIEKINERVDLHANILEDFQHRDDNIYRQIFEAEPIPSTVRNAGFGGTNRYEELEKKKNFDIVVETWKTLDSLTRKIYVQSKSFDEIIKLARNKEQMLKSIPAIMPMNNSDITYFASGFGYRIHPIYKTRRMHSGVDFAAPKGKEIYATGDGVVVKSGYGRGYGKHIVIDHGYSYKTYYAHMSKINVRRGQKIKRGDVVGLVGSTGTSTGNHLHYEVRKNNRPVNPVHYYMNDLSPAEYAEMLEKSKQPTQSLD